MKTPYWNSAGRHFDTTHPPHEVEIGGKIYDLRTNLTTTGQGHSNIYTSLKERDQIMPSTDTVVFFPGWGETSPHFEAGMLEPTIKNLQEETKGRISYIGMNLAGKGTPEYAERKDHSKTSLQDHLEDAANTSALLAENNEIIGNVHIIGHSMGALDAMAAWEKLETIKDKTKAKVESVTLMAPTTDDPFAFTDLGFLWQVRSKLPSTAKQMLQGWKGSLDLTSKEYEAIMGGDITEYQYTVPDSAQRFFNQAMNYRRLFNRVIEKAKGTKVKILGFEQDHLIPRSTPENLAQYLKSTNPRLIVEHFTVNSFPSHLLPTNIAHQQEAELRTILKR